MSNASTGWLSSRPPEHIQAKGLLLERALPSDNADLVEAVNDSLGHLSPWMPWAQERATQESIGTFLAQATSNWLAGTEFHYLLRRAASSPIIGCSGLHARIGAGALEIGYWVRVGHLRRGVATVAAGALTAAALALTEVERVEIRCDATNTRSALVPPTCGYRMERIEHRPPTAPGETDQQMIWILDNSSPRPEGHRFP
jgi:RimJ/RimL family protein N-acetyltransferase